MIADIHNHVGFDKDGTSQSMHQLKKKMRKDGINKVVIFPFNEPTKDLIKTSIELIKYKNDSVIPFLRFDPNKHRPEEVRKALNEYNFAGVKLHPFSQRFNPTSKRFYRFYKVIEDAGVPLLFHTFGDIDNNDPAKTAKLARDFNDLTIVLAHFAGFSSEAIKEVGGRDNLYIETSIISTPRVIEMVVDKVGAEKIIFGSDSPYADQELEIHTVKRAKIRNKERNKILYGNISKIIHL